MGIPPSNAAVGSLRIAINRFLPNGQPNHKVGVAYGEATPGKSHQDKRVREWRGLLRWNVNLPFRGKGQLSAIVGERNARLEARGFFPARLDGPNPDWLAAENTLRYHYCADEPGRSGSRYLPDARPGFTYGFVHTGFASTEFKDIKYLQTVAATPRLDDRVSLVPGLGNRPGGWNIGTAKPITGNVGAVASFAYRYATSCWVQDINASYSKRFGRYNWRVQINVNNLFDKDDLLFNRYTTYRVLGQGSNPFVGGVVNNGVTYPWQTTRPPPHS